MGREGAGICLQSGANDLGGTLMNESITRAAGGVNGQEMGYIEMTQLVNHLGRQPQQRSTLYDVVNGHALAKHDQSEHLDQALQPKLSATYLNIYGQRQEWL